MIIPFFSRFKRRKTQKHTLQEITEAPQKSFNYKLREMQSTHFKFLQENLKRIRIIAGIEVPPIENLSFKLVKMDLPDYVRDKNIVGLIQSIAKELGKELTDKQINEENELKLFSFLFWVLDEFTAINEREKYLETSPDIDALNAGMSAFDKYQQMNTVDSLSGGDIFKWKEVLALPYIDVFTKQMMQKDTNEFNKKYQEIQRQKSKNKR